MAAMMKCTCSAKKRRIKAFLKDPFFQENNDDEDDDDDYDDDDDDDNDDDDDDVSCE